MLKARYSSGGNRRTAFLLEQALKIMLTDIEPLQPQLDKVIFATQQLTASNILIPDIVIAHHIALNLPESYTTLHQILVSSDPTKMTSKWVIDQVLAEEHHLITQSGGSMNTFFTKAQKNKSERDNYNNKNCNYCKRRGHDTSECHKKKKDKENGASNATNTPTSGASTTSSSSMAAKANVAIAEDDLIVLFDPSDNYYSPITNAFVARAQMTQRASSITCLKMTALLPRSLKVLPW